MKDRPMEYEIRRKEVLYDGFFRLERYAVRHSLFAGGSSGTVVRELLERGHAAAVLPYDPVRDEIVLIEQFRIGALEMPGGAWLREIVAGIIKEGESAEEVVLREAKEEAGCVIEALEPIHHYLVSPGGTSEQITLFCGRVSSEGLGGLHGLDEEHEDIRATVVAFEEARRMLEGGQILSATPIIALQWLVLNRERLRRQWGVEAKA